jgi:hypothetical protein
MAGEGDYPLRSAWLGRGRGRGRGRGANPRKVVNVAAVNSANEAVWTDWAFNAAGPPAQTLIPLLFTNTQTFPASTITVGAVTLAPALFTNGQTFPSASLVASYALAAPLITNDQTFYAATISATGGTQSLTADLFANEATFFAATIANASGTPAGAAKKRRRISFNPQPVDLYEIFKVEQNNAAIIAALELA